MTRLLKEAQLRELPFLAGVDEYDDTIFNRRQTHTVALELVELREMTEIRNQVEDIEAAIGIVQQRPHRYLVFNGD
ncbi:hypothetical protein [Luteimicrobium subarcticum]|uniref:hypothetical protein n=1 Tax=Luteimicrobium subarcticum TaxID=620910 RepID=UPI0012FE4261|nr:hypothetical protein [Luteimicrobium subarcticum]